MGNVLELLLCCLQHQASEPSAQKPPTAHISINCACFQARNVIDQQDGESFHSANEIG